MIKDKIRLNELKALLQHNFRKEDEMNFIQVMKECDELEQIEKDKVRHMLAVYLQSHDKN